MFFDYDVIFFWIEEYDELWCIVYCWNNDDVFGKLLDVVDEVILIVFIFMFEEFDGGIWFIVVEFGFECIFDLFVNFEVYCMGWDLEFDKMVVLVEGEV